MRFLMPITCCICPYPPRITYLGMRFLMPLAPFATTLKEGARRLADVAVGPASLVQGQAAAAMADPGRGQEKGAPGNEEAAEGAAVACGSGRWGAAGGGRLCLAPPLPCPAPCTLRYSSEGKLAPRSIGHLRTTPACFLLVPPQVLFPGQGDAA